MTTPPTRRTDLQTYRVGDVTWGAEIGYIYGASRDAIVFRSKDGTTQWELLGDSLSEIANLAHARHDALRSQMRASLPRAAWPDYEADLGIALFHALCEPMVDSASRHFLSVEGRMAEDSLQRGRRSYFYAGSAALAVVGILALLSFSLPLVPSAKEFLQALGTGSLGAWTSILQRGWRLPLVPFQTVGQFAFQGATRILLGAAFAFVTVLGVKAQLFLGFAAERPWALMAFAFLAGISERFVPELLRDLESSRGPVSNHAHPAP